MEREISQHLKDKLKIIEVETEFFSRKPERPTYSRFGNYAAIALIVGSIYLVSTSDDKALGFMFLGLAGVNFITYWYQKQLFDMYSSAVEIIKFYKDSDAGEI